MIPGGLSGRRSLAADQQPAIAHVRSQRGGIRLRIQPQRRTVSGKRLARDVHLQPVPRRQVQHLAREVRVRSRKVGDHQQTRPRRPASPLPVRVDPPHRLSHRFHAARRFLIIRHPRRPHSSVRRRFHYRERECPFLDRVGVFRRIRSQPHLPPPHRRRPRVADQPAVRIQPRLARRSGLVGAAARRCDPRPCPVLDRRYLRLARPVDLLPRFPPHCIHHLQVQPVRRLSKRWGRRLRG